MKYLCKVIKRPLLIDIIKGPSKEYKKFMSKPNYFLPKKPLKNNIKPNMSRKPFYCYPLENNYTGIDPLKPSSLKFFKTMAKLCKIDDSLSKEKILEEIKKKIPYLHLNRKEQNIQALIDFTKEKTKTKTKKKTKIK